MSSVAPFFSVVIPVHNKAPFVDRCIRSVLSQTFSDFELLLVEDASTDDSLNEIQKFSDPRIRLLHRDIPGAGGYAARNLGISESHADWVAFLDADDEWYPEHLGLLRVLAGKSKGGVVAASWLLDYGDSALLPNAFATFHARLTTKSIDFAEFLTEAANKRIPIWTSSVAARRDLLLDVGGFPEYCRKGGDTAAWLRVVKEAGELTVSTQATAVYHRVDSFVTANFAPEIRDNCVRNACLQLLEEAPGDKRICRLLKRVSNVHVSYGLRRRASEGLLRFSDCREHYFAVDCLDHVFFRLHGLLPRFLQRGAKSWLSALKRIIMSPVSSRRSSPS